MIAIEEDIQNFKYNQRLRCNYKELAKYLEFKGFIEFRQRNATHKIWKNQTTGKTIPVPVKKGTLPQGTVSKILNQINSERIELAKFLYEQ